MVLSSDRYYINKYESNNEIEICRHKDCPIKDICFIADIFKGLGLIKICPYLKKDTSECTYYKNDKENKI